MATHIEDLEVTKRISKRHSKKRHSTKRHSSKRNSVVQMMKQQSDPDIVFNMNPLFFKAGLDDENSLKAILEHPEKRHKFLEFCAKANAEENVMFFEAVYEFEHYSQVIKASEKRRTALKIIGEYIVEGSPNEVNISAGTRSDLLDIGEDDFQSDSFTAAKREIFDLIRGNFYNKYLSEE